MALTPTAPVYSNKIKVAAPKASGSMVTPVKKKKTVAVVKPTMTRTRDLSFGSLK
jgi:hypothetical protein